MAPAGPVLAAYILTTFLSALLLFSIQPMFAKMVLPLLGGASSVWAVAIFFFQAALLAGYCYAHLLIAHVPFRLAGAIHVIVCLIALLSLPIALPAGWTEPPAYAPYMWQLGLFTVAIGLPFLAVSANAPLLQAWFARSGHKTASDPYFLYAASNLGSLIALLGYPFLLEPALGLTALSRVWTIGYLMLMLLIATAFVLVTHRRYAAIGGRLSHGAPSEETAVAADAPLKRSTWSDRLRWVWLALIPAALLTAFSTHITTDIASAPLLWVLPLSLYLLTFVLVFRATPLISSRWLLALHLAAIVLVFLALSQRWFDDWFVTAATGVIVFFTSAMVAHRTLYEARPHVGHLTEFYLWMSVGGALGGLAAALVAPRIFNEIFEYPLLLALTMACRPGVFESANRRSMMLQAAAILAVGATAVIAAPLLLGYLAADLVEWTPAFLLVCAATLLLLVYRRQPTHQLAVALVICLAVVTLPSAVRQGDAQRSYFGVYRVHAPPDEAFRTLMHGTTLHGAQRIRDKSGKPIEDTTPATYYYPGGPMARTISTVRARIGEGKGRYGVVGLGAGSLACYARPGESWRFYEIDPLMIEIARDPRQFTFLSQCMPQADIVVGDARITLSREPDASFDLLIIDAFSSDSVPIHLMTGEALRLYLAKVKPDGVVLLHISNKYLDLDAVFGATVALVPGVAGFTISDGDADDDDEAEADSTVAVMSRTPASLAPLRELNGVEEPDGRDLRGWTDDYSDILGPFLLKLREGD
jgi:hypothetical protein